MDEPSSYRDANYCIRPAARGVPTPTPSSPAPKPAVPEFDVVRVDSSGNAVIAGRAAPGALVTYM